MGWLLKDQLNVPSLTAASVLTASATLFSAYWIQRAFRRESDQTKVLTDAIATTCKETCDLVEKAVGHPITTSGHDDVLLLELALLSNKVTHLVGIADDFPQQVEELRDAYFWLKTALTKDSTVNSKEAGRAGVALRGAVLRAQFQLCRSIAEGGWDRQQLEDLTKKF